MDSMPIAQPAEPIADNIAVQEILPADVVESSTIKEVVEEPVQQNKVVDEKEQSQVLNMDELADKIAEGMNNIARVFNASLNFSVDKPTGKSVIKVVDKKTEELIRQIPTEEMLKLMGKMRDMMGMLLDVEV